MFKYLMVLTFMSTFQLLFGQDPKSINPNNSNASISLSWYQDTPRLRIGGTGIGTENGFLIQGKGDKTFLRVNEGNIVTYNPENPLAQIGMSWYQNTPRLRIGGTGEGTNNGFLIQGTGDKTFFRVNNGAIRIYNPNSSAEVGLSWDNNQARIRIGGTGIGSKNGLEIQTTGDVKLMTISHSGNVAVYGKFEAEEIKVQSTPTADFVFNDDYKLKNIHEVESFIKENKHLPDFPSGKELEKNGVNLGEMDAKLLQKIEELTLYMIEMNKRINSLETENSELKEEIKKMKPGQ